MPSKFRNLQVKKKKETKEKIVFKDEPSQNQQFQEEDMNETNRMEVNKLIEEMSKIVTSYEEESQLDKQKPNQKKTIVQKSKNIKKGKHVPIKQNNQVQEMTVLEIIMRDQTKDIVENLNSQLLEIQTKISEKYSKKEKLIEAKFKELENQTQQEELIEQLENSLAEQNPQINSENQYKVEKILDRKLTKLGFIYKIQWEGFSQNHYTWERIENLSDIIELVKEFDISQAGVIAEQTLQFEQELQKKQNRQTQLEKLKQVIENQFKMIRDSNEDNAIQETEQQYN